MACRVFRARGSGPKHETLNPKPCRAFKVRGLGGHAGFLEGMGALEEVVDGRGHSV